MLTEEKREQGQGQREGEGQETAHTRTVAAPLPEVYRAFTHPVALRDWLCDVAEVEPRTGGRVYLAWDNDYYTAGKYTELARNERVAFTWRGPSDPADSQVLVTLAQAAEGVTVTVTHAGAANEWAEGASASRLSWDTALENLQSLLETGRDLRLIRRPMFGLNGADTLTAEMAAELGLPVEEGLRLTGLVEGLAAHNAGLRPNDVLVSLGGHPVRDYGSLGGALGLRRAGDQVPATFYRDGEQQTVTLELSARQLPPVPETMQELAVSLRKDNAQVAQELDSLVESVTDEEAEYRSSEDNWNAKEVLAHLIASEYDGHVTIGNFVADAPDDPAYYANDLLRLRPLAAAHGSIAALAEELKRSQQVTAEMLANMPAPASKRKRNVFRLGLGYVGFAEHTRDHFNEIRALVEAARAK